MPPLFGRQHVRKSRRDRAPTRAIDRALTVLGYTGDLNTAMPRQKRAAIGVEEKEVNIRNKLSRGKFTAAFLLQCLKSIGSETIHLR